MKRLDMVTLKHFGVTFSITYSDMFPALLEQTVLFQHVESNRKVQI